MKRKLPPASQGFFELERLGRSASELLALTAQLLDEEKGWIRTPDSVADWRRKRPGEKQSGTQTARRGVWIIDMEWTDTGARIETSFSGLKCGLCKAQVEPGVVHRCGEFWAPAKGKRGKAAK